MLFAVRVSTPEPLFTSTPVAPLIAPEYNVELPPLRVRVLVSSRVNPAPAMLAISSERASMSVPAAPTLTAIESISADPPASVRMPAFTATVPLKVLVPASVSSPAPALTRFAVPDTTPPNFTALATVRVVSAVIAALPFKFNKPYLLESPMVSAPDNTNRLANALSNTDSTDNVPPLKVSVPEPSAKLDPTCNAPALRRTPPAKVFEPDKTKADGPFFTSAPDPLITPPNAEAAAPLSVSVLPCRLTEPAPARLPNSSDATRFNVPPALTLTVAEFNSALPPTRFTVPAFTASVPVKVFTPDRVNSAVPPFTKLPVPLITPDKATALTAFTVELPASNPFPVNASAPAFAESPSVKVPSISSVFAICRAAAESLERRPPLSDKVPLPSARLFPIWIVPAASRTPPVKVFDPVSASADCPVFQRLPDVPLITPPKVVDAIPPTVSVLLCRFTDPVPARLPISSALANRSVPAASIISAAVFAIAVPPAIVRMPALTVVVPVKVFTPASVSWPAPALLNPNAPLTTPFKATALSTVSATLEARVTAPPIVRVPAFATLPNPSVPESVSALLKLRAVAESLETRPPLITIAPIPNA